VHAAFVAVLVANGSRVEPGQHALMGGIALILAAVPIADTFISVAGSWRRIITDRTYVHGQVRRALYVDAVAHLGRIAGADTLAAHLTCWFHILHAGACAVAEIDGIARLSW